MNTLVTKAKNFLNEDSAENSIMQTISIAVSAILIAAGLITAPSLINNARDVNAKGDLANLAYAEEFHLADQGVYSGDLTALKNIKGSELPGGVKATYSQDVADFNIQVGTGTDGDATFSAVVKSDSGKFFKRTSDNTTVTQVKNLAGDAITAP